MPRRPPFSAASLALCMCFTVPSSAAFVVPQSRLASHGSGVVASHHLATSGVTQRRAAAAVTARAVPHALANSAAALTAGGAKTTAAAVATGLRGGAVGVGGALSLLPPVATLAVALLSKQVTVALLVGIWSGCLLLYDMQPAAAFLRCFDTHLVDAVVDREHATVILFNLVLGGTIGLVQKGGGALGLAKALRTFARDANSLLATAAALSAMVFFDDYASILIVGNSFRSLLPLLGVCKEKFAAVVHYVAVCVSATMPVSSWIGLQVGAASTATAAIRLGAGGQALPDPFVLTLATVPYRLFPLSLLAFVAALLATGKDFGPMAAAVDRSDGPTAAESGGGGDDGDDDDVEAAGALVPKPGTPLRALNAIVPFGAIIAVTLGGMVTSGRAALAAQVAQAATGGVAHSAAPPAITVAAALAAGNACKALLWGSASGMLTAMALLLGQRILSLGEAMETFTAGMKDVVEPVVVLALAWALGGIISAAGTADFIAKVLTAGGLPVWALPAMASVLAYVISFATGSSFGTIGILFPLVGPLAWTLGHGSLPVLLHSFGAVYGGSLFGNVFSPIADCTVLTVLATKTSIQDHCATAAPYALLVGALCLCGDLAVGLGTVGPYKALGLVVAAQTAILYFAGKTKESRAAKMANAKA